MKIAITVDPELPVPPLHYGGIERIVSMLIDEYSAEGHEIALFAHGNSTSKATLFAYSGTNSRSKIDTIKNINCISREVYKGKFDILHSFSRLAYLSLVLPLRLPKIMSYQRRPTPSQIRRAEQLSHKGSLIFTGCSDFITRQVVPFAKAFTVYNGFPTETYHNYSTQVSDDAPLVFLGRIEPVKGTHHAIDIAKKANKPLVIAGNIPPKHQSYFDEMILPAIDGRNVIYLGAVDDTQKADLLNNALALLMPIEWDEPFGIVMVEAMACGTPVIALDRGAASEVIDQGLTGYHCKNISECIEKVVIVNQLNRTLVRRQAMLRFSSKVIAQNYLTLYRDIINGQLTTCNS
jgi:glycosyltransferase involved in cell wall biosynthesis